MTTTLMPLPKFRAFDSAGAPLVGGKVYTYEAGTNTPLATYTDYSGLSANTNPVILDANGEANIWLAQQQYKIVLRDANDVLQWTVDNVGQNSLADLSAGFGQATDIASATTVDLGTIVTHFANITGTTAITSFGSSAELTAPIYLIKFNGALTLTNGANLITPTGANITTANNDRAFVEYLGSGSWRIISYMKADGGVIGGVLAVANGGTGFSSYAVGDTIYASATNAFTKLPKGTAFQLLRMNSGATAPEWSNPVIVDRAYAETATYQSLSTTIPFDDTIPQNTEGTQILTASITPKTTTNRIRATLTVFGCLNAGSSNLVAALFLNSTANAFAVSGPIGTTTISTTSIVAEFVAGTTSACNINARVGSGAGTFFINGDSGGRKYGGAFKSTLVLEEIYA